MNRLEIAVHVLKGQKLALVDFPSLSQSDKEFVRSGERLTVAAAFRIADTVIAYNNENKE